MKTDTANENISSRRFVNSVRAKLDTGGHASVGIDRLWVDEDTPGYPFLLHVPVGAELIISLMPLDGFFDAKSAEDLDWHIGYFAEALVNLGRGEKMLLEYVHDVRYAAVTEIAAARSAGLDLVLDGVGLKPTCAWHLTGDSLEEAMSHVLAEVRVRHTSFHLRPGVSTLLIEEPADVSQELEELRYEQRQRQNTLAELEAVGADLEVDAITLDLLEAHGLDAEQILRDAWKHQCVNLTVQHLGREASLSLMTSAGKVEASLDLEDAIWNGKHLWLRKEGKTNGHAGLVGKSLGDLVQHPAFSARPIIGVDPSSRDLIRFDLSIKHLFDADTGRIWERGGIAA